MSKITLNIVEPGSPMPISPSGGIDPSVPNTGLFTHGIGAPEATIIAVSVILALALVAAIVWYCKKHTNIRIANIARLFKNKKRITVGLTAVALLVSAGTFAGLLTSSDKGNTSAAEGEGDLTVDVSDEELTIELADEPVFAVLPVEVSVEEATQAGYTLTAYTTSPDIVSDTTDAKVSMVTLPEGVDTTALTDNTWGLALAEPEDESAEEYYALPLTEDEAMVIKSIPDYTPTEENDITTIYYGFYIAPDMPTGIYTGAEVEYHAERNYITNLSFNGNGSDGGEEMEGITIPAGDTITLPENTYTKEGYTFTGWNTNAEGTGQVYVDKAEYTAIAGESADVILYAQWKKNAPFMQDVATWGSILEIGDETIAVDSRDGKEYYVARLADNNIWMTQNLDHNIVSTPNFYTYENTDIGHGATPNPSATWTGTATRATSDITWTGSNTTPESYEPGVKYWNGNFRPTNQADCEASGGIWQPWGVCEGVDLTSSTGNSHYHLGNYYNWTAAVAMSDSSGYTASGYTADNADVDQSICPAGWRLPTNSGNKSFDNLVTEASLTAGASGNIHTTPNWFTYGGDWNGSLSDIGNRGRYWSSVVTNTSGSYDLSFYGYGALNPQFSDNRNNGFSVRCVAR